MMTTMISTSWLEQCSHLLDERTRCGLLRQRKIVRPIDATHLEIDGRSFTNFCSNNYLGFTHHPKLLEAMRSSQQSGAGSGAAGLISGYSESHAQAESAIADWKGAGAAVLLPSGYQANIAAVQTLAAIGDSYKNGARFLIDKLAHASLIDAARATQMPIRIFPHNGMNKLQRLLDDAPADQLQIVLTESIFSMDGDAADLAGIAKLKQSHDFILLLDEAHGSGVYGQNGAGLAAEIGLQNAVDVSVVTLSKALGSVGGAVCSSKAFRDALLNFGRAYIYSTSIPPAIAECASSAVALLRDEPQHQRRVRELAKRVRARLSSAGQTIPAGDSPIIPVILGSEAEAMRAAEVLHGLGLLVVAVRPPTVPKGTSRLRITVSAAHSDEEIDRLVGAMGKLSA
jgi:8-amino-7-oxononanoate synthase